MKLKTIRFEGKLCLVVSRDNTNFDEDQKYCGESWCDGRCGLPALVLNHSTEGEFKAHSNMVACGPVWQRFRVAWQGNKVPVDMSGLDPDNTLQMMWW